MKSKNNSEMLKMQSKFVKKTEELNIKDKDFKN